MAERRKYRIDWATWALVLLSLFSGVWYLSAKIQELSDQVASIQAQHAQIQAELAELLARQH